MNVLLKELESCPVTCIIIGATNHPDLLDKAIWRRFDRALEITLPEKNQRQLLLQRGMGKRLKEIDNEVIEIVLNGTDQMSAADLCKMCEHVKRRIIINPEYTPTACMLREYCEFVDIRTREQKVLICKALKDNYEQISIKKISELTGIPTTSVNRYLKE